MNVKNTPGVPQTIPTRPAFILEGIAGLDSFLFNTILMAKLPWMSTETVIDKFAFNGQVSGNIALIGGSLRFLRQMTQTTFRLVGTDSYREQVKNAPAESYKLDQFFSVVGNDGFFGSKKVYSQFDIEKSGVENMIADQTFEFISTSRTDAEAEAFAKYIKHADVYDKAWTTPGNPTADYYGYGISNRNGWQQSKTTTPTGKPTGYVNRISFLDFTDPAKFNSLQKIAEALVFSISAIWNYMQKMGLSSHPETKITPAPNSAPLTTTYPFCKGIQKDKILTFIDPQVQNIFAHVPFFAGSGMGATALVNQPIVSIYGFEFMPCINLPIVSGTSSTGNGTFRILIVSKNRSYFFRNYVSPIVKIIPNPEFAPDYRVDASYYYHATSVYEGEIYAIDIKLPTVLPALSTAEGENTRLLKSLAKIFGVKETEIQEQSTSEIKN